MGLRAALKSHRVYFDANIFIYLLEGFSEFEVDLAAIRESILHQECEIHTSGLTLCEVLVLPFRQNNTQLIAQYRSFIEGSGAFTIHPTTVETYLRASLYRGQFGMKTPDAIHIATAVENNCSVFLTNDQAIKGPSSMTIIHLTPLIAK